MACPIMKNWKTKNRTGVIIGGRQKCWAMPSLSLEIWKFIWMTEKCNWSFFRNNLDIYKKYKWPLFENIFDFYKKYNWPLFENIIWYLWEIQSVTKEHQIQTMYYSEAQQWACWYWGVWRDDIRRIAKTEYFLIFKGLV